MTEHDDGKGPTKSGTGGGARRNRGRPIRKKAEKGEKRSTPTLSRLVATRVLERVERTHAYADLALHHALARSNLSGPDRALTTELVFGTLRWRGRIDFQLARVLNQDLESLEPLVASILRLGAYQLMFSDRIPAHAAVDQSVLCARATGNVRASGLVNAVLRRLSREWQEVVFPSLEDDPIEHLVHALSMPPWIAKRFVELYGPRNAAALAEASNRPPPLTIRANRLRIAREPLLERVRGTFPDARLGKLGEDAIVLGHGGDPGQDEAFRDGLYTVQDEASQLVVALLDPQPGEQILDTCSAPGTKTTGIAERLAGEGAVLALDRNPRRLALVARAARRLELTNVNVLHRDATRSLEDLPVPGAPESDAEMTFDRILVDAPCSGLGSLRRNPDARWRLQESDPGRLAIIQRKLLERAAPVLRPGGTLVYSTCTLLPEENEELVREFLEQHPELRLMARDQLPDSLGPVLSREGFMRCTPHEHDTDGFFAARLERLP